MALSSLVGTEKLSVDLLRGNDTGDSIVPFAQGELRRNEQFFNTDPVFRAAFNTLTSFMYGATVIASRVKGIPIGDMQKTRSGQNHDSNRLATSEFQLFVDRVFPQLIVPVVRALWVDGFVAYTIEKSGEFKVPMILHSRAFTPAIRLKKNRHVDLVGVMADRQSVDPSIHMFSRETHTHTGEVISLASILYPAWEEQRVLRNAAVTMDQIASQNLQLVESAPAGKATEPEVSLFADADRFESEKVVAYYDKETNLEQFHALNEREDRRLLVNNGIIAPTLKPIPDRYRIAKGVYPTTRADLSSLEEARSDVVFAACGVPKSLVMSTNKMSADSSGAFRTVNMTLRRMRLLLADVFRQMYLDLYPEDTDVLLEVEIEGLIVGDQIETAGLNGFISEEDFGRIYLQNANIPINKLYKGLSKKPAKAESRELQPKLGSVVDGAAAEVKQRQAAKEKESAAKKKATAQPEQPVQPVTKKAKTDKK